VEYKKLGEKRKMPEYTGISAYVSRFQVPYLLALPPY
jgi:hypothetical protein